MEILLRYEGLIIAYLLITAQFVFAGRKAYGPFPQIRDRDPLRHVAIIWLALAGLIVLDIAFGFLPHHAVPSDVTAFRVAFYIPLALVLLIAVIARLRRAAPSPEQRIAFFVVSLLGVLLGPIVQIVFSGRPEAGRLVVAILLAVLPVVAIGGMVLWFMRRVRPGVR